MGFDWKAFAAAFLDKQTEGIRERKEEAKEYEDEQEELAKANRKIIADRTLLASEYGQLGKKAMELGATKEQVMAAMGSGALGIKTFYDKLLAAANQKGISTLGPSDVEAIIDMPEVFEVNPDYIDMNLNELAQIQYGAKMKPGTRPADVQTSDSVLATLFGVNAMDQAKQKLQDTKAVGGMSIADINELAAQSEYNSLFPNLGVNFFDKEFYGPESASKFLKDLVEIETEAANTPAAKARIQAAGEAFAEKMRSEKPEDQEWIEEQKRLNRTFRDAEADQRELIIVETAMSVIEGAIGTYGETGLFDHEPSVNIMKRIMGEDWVNGEIELIKNFNQQEQPEESQPEPSSEQPPNTEQNQEEQTQETTETETSDTTNQETALPPEERVEEVEVSVEEKKEALLNKTFPTRPSRFNAKRVGWDRDYEGKVDPESGKVIMAPPRPPEGGEKTKELPSYNQFGVRNVGKFRKVTEAEYWDATYGGTHDTMTGLPIGLYEIMLGLED